MRCKKILLINNNAEENNEIAEALASLNCEHSLHTARLGNEALYMLMGSASAQNKANKVQPDIILLDEKLPDMTGLEFLGIMRRYYSLKGITVFILGEEAGGYDRVTLSRLGVMGVLAKPLDFLNTESPAVDEFKAQMSSSHHGSFMSMPLFFDSRDYSGGILQFFKSKLAYFSQAAFGYKAALLCASASIVGVTATVSTPFKGSNRSRQPIEETRVHPVAAKTPVKEKPQDQPCENTSIEAAATLNADPSAAPATAEQPTEIKARSNRSEKSREKTGETAAWSPSICIVPDNQ